MPCTGCSRFWLVTAGSNRFHPVMAASGWSWPVTAGSSLLVAAGSDSPSEEKGLGGLLAVFNPPQPALPTPGIKHFFQNSVSKTQ